MQPKKMLSTQKDHLTNRAKTRASIKVNVDEVSSPGDSSDDLTSEHSSTEDSSDLSSLDDWLPQSSGRQFDLFKDVYYDCNIQDCEDCDGAQDDHLVVEENINLEDDNIVMEDLENTNKSHVDIESWNPSWNFFTC